MKCNRGSTWAPSFKLILIQGKADLFVFFGSGKVLFAVGKCGSKNWVTSIRFETLLSNTTSSDKLISTLHEEQHVF